VYCAISHIMEHDICLILRRIESIRHVSVDGNAYVRTKVRISPSLPLLPSLLPRPKNTPHPLRTKGVLRLCAAGAGDGTRTRTGLPPTVFKTVASAISPLRRALPRYDSMLSVREQPAAFPLLNDSEPIIWKEHIPLRALHS
jgi:hypothetical protein